MSKTFVISRFWQLSPPLSLAVLALLAEAGGEPARLVLRYQRETLANGELWRALTGHLVHLGPGHAAMNVAALGVMTYLFAGLLKGLDWCVAALLAALAIAGGLFWLSPAVEWYVGLSGVLHGFWAAACVQAFRQHRREAWALTALIVLKLGYEALSGPVPLSGQLAAGPVVAVAHLYGAAGGVLSGFLTPAIRSLRRPL